MGFKSFIYVGGMYHLCFALFDLSWPFIFNWRKTLANLDDLNKSILFILSRLNALLFVSFAYLEFFQIDELINSTIGNLVLLYIVIFWSIRAAMNLQFFGFFKKANHLKVVRSDLNFPFAGSSNQVIVNAFFFIFIFGIIVHLIPLLYSTG
ncbi:MAG: hypothetical protein C0403_17720 [Desulfobacterium sp.]|nr:hypothetical protein [Desulfobacterium sp.]